VLNIYNVTLEVVNLTASVLPVIQRSDADLARQLRRAVCSIPLNVGEGMYSRGKLRQARYHTALGSAREVLACIEVALAIGYLRQPPLALVAKLNHVIGVLVKLVR
jgi:four helix bundle protein